MSEIKIVVDHLRLSYTGTMQVKELFKIINRWSFERQLQKKEDRDHEYNEPDGKHIEYEISHWKKISDYIKYIFKVRAIFKGIKKVEITMGKRKIKADHGTVTFFFDGFVEYDYEHRWDERPMFVFLRSIYDKFIYRPYSDRFDDRLVKEVNDLKNELETFLNMYRYHKVVSKAPYF
ncbi:MAG TPA: hypothetical protein VFF28_03860 [Candidatus Nanoarchaeia archaeon]|nr:hypothetical protein [Candidatus Nanoarchaeia archaeon]